jgi:hypothetical protein
MAVSNCESYSLNVFVPLEPALTPNIDHIIQSYLASGYESMQSWLLATENGVNVPYFMHTSTKLFRSQRGPNHRGEDQRLTSPESKQRGPHPHIAAKRGGLEETE